MPSNYNAPTPAPSEADAAPVTKPADMGGMASTDVSPQVVSPDKPVAVPGDKGYVAPPAGTVDTNDHPVVPVVDPDSGQLVVPTTPDPTPTPDPDPTPPTPVAPGKPVFSDDKIAGDDTIDRHELLSGVTITGTADKGSGVTVWVSDGSNQVRLATETTDGTFTAKLTADAVKDLKDGSLTFTATAQSISSALASKEQTKTGITLDAGLDATFSASEEGGVNLGLTAPEGFDNTTPGLDTLMGELQTVYDNVTGSKDYSTVEALATDAPNFAKLVHFYADNYKVNQTVTSSSANDVLNLSAHDIYGGGLSLSLADLNAATGGSGRVAALQHILGEAKFDLPVIKASATDVVNLEVNKVGSTITEEIDSSLWHSDITFSELVGLVPGVKPIAVEANAKTLDLRLAADGDASVINLMEVRGTVENITFSGTEGRFGINVDTDAVATIDASSLTDTGSGVYVNTAPIEVHVPLGKGDPSLGFHADVADNLTFKGSAGDDLLVMTAEKYAKIASVDGGAGDDDTLVIVNDGDGELDTNNDDSSTEYTVTFKEGTSGFENIGLASFEHLPDARFIIEDASTFTGVKQFITTNDLKIANMASGTEISVVSLMDSDVKLDLTADSAGGSVTLNLAMTDNFLMHLDGLLGDQGSQKPHGKATLTNADNISGLTLTGADANADILLSDEALKDLNGKTIDVTKYAGDIQYASGWAYSDTSLTKTDGSTSYTVTLSGVQAGTAITGEEASA